LYLVFIQFHVFLYLPMTYFLVTDVPCAIFLLTTTDLFLYCTDLLANNIAQFVVVIVYSREMVWG